MELVGWLGNILLALCALPLAWSAYRNKSVVVDWLFFQMWFWGEMLGLTYAIYIEALPIIANYLINLSCLLMIWYYRKD